MVWRWMRLTGRWSTSRGRCGRLLPYPLPDLSHQPVCWNPGSHLAGQGIWKGARGQAKEAYQVTKTRPFPVSFTLFIHLHFSALPALISGAEANQTV